jgi:drug/metabolite transporter (DMT)-like permease
MLPDRRTGIVYAILCLILLGVMPILSASRPAGADGLIFTIGLTFWQFLFALPVTAAEAASGRARVSLRQGLRGRQGLIALVTGAIFGVSTLCYVVAAERAGPVNLVIALQSYPFIAMVLEAAVQGKRRSLAEIGWTLLMVVALVFLITGGTFRAGDLSAWTAFALVIPVMWSVAHMMLKRVMETTQVTPNQVTISRLAISGLLLVLAQMAFGREGGLAGAFASFAFHKAALMMGLAYYLELLFWYSAMRHIDVSLGSSVTVPAPAITILVSVFLTGGTVALWQVAAMVVITLALYGLLWSGARKRRAG